MAKIYAELIRKGLKTIGQIPTEKQQEVKEKLIEMGYPELADPDHQTKEETV